MGNEFSPKGVWVRAKFRVTSKQERWGGNYPTGATTVLDKAHLTDAEDCTIEVELNPVWEQGDDGQAVEENRIFGHATPSGKIGMLIRNRHAAERFLIGQSYYVDFTPVEN